MSQIPDPQLRVTEAQREHALAVIRDAAADGRLQHEELDDRTSRALSSFTRGDLAEVLHDLVPSADLPEVIGSALPLGDAPGMSWDNPLVLRTRWTWRDWGRTKVIAGPWQVPPFVEVNASPGSMRLNFSEAHALAPVIDLVVVLAVFSELTLVVPDGWGVDTTGVTGDAYSTLTTIAPTRPRKGLPRIVVRGRSSGAIKVREPKPRDLKDALKATPLLEITS